MSFPVQCSACEEVLTLKDEARQSVGKKIRCPKCGELFVIRKFTQTEDDDPEIVDAADWEEEDEPQRTRASSRKRSAQRGKQRTGKSSGNRPLLIGAGAFGGVAITAIVLWLVLGNRAPEQNAAGVALPVMPNPPVAANSNGVNATPTPATSTTSVPVTTPTSVPIAANASTQAPSGDAARYQAFATKLEADIVSTRTRALVDAVSWDTMLNRALTGVDLDPQSMATLKATGAIQMKTQFSTELRKGFDRDASYRFLRHHMVGTEHRVLFRFVGASGLNYHDCEMGIGPNGEPQIVDLYIALTGEKMSETLRNLMLLAEANPRRGAQPAANSTLADFQANLVKIQLFNTYKQNGKHAAALQTWKELPPSVQRVKSLALARLFSAMEVGGQEYDTAVSEFRQWFPNDPSLDFQSIDFFMRKKQWDDALQAVDRFDKSIGGDVYLNMSRCDILVELKRLPDARKAVEAVIAGEPKLKIGYMALVGVALTQQDFKTVATTLQTLKRDHQHDLGDLRRLPAYAEFVKSPEYQEYVRSTPTGAGGVPIASSPVPGISTSTVAGGGDRQSLNRLGQEHLDTEKFDLAKQVFTTALRQAGTQRDLLALESLIGLAQSRRFDIDQDRVDAIYKEIFDLLPRLNAQQTELGVRAHLAHAFFQLGNSQYRDARQAFEAGLKAVRGLTPAQPVLEAKLLTGLCLIFKMNDEHTEARSQLEQALKLLEPVNPLPAKQLTSTARSLAETCETLADFAAAETYYRRIVSMTDAVSNLPAVHTTALSGLGRACLGQGKLTEAETAFQQAHDQSRVRNRAGILPPNYAHLVELAEAQKQLRNFTAAETSLRDLLKAFDGRPLTVFDRASIDAKLDLALISEIQNRSNEARLQLLNGFKEMARFRSETTKLGDTSGENSDSEFSSFKLAQTLVTNKQFFAAAEVARSLMRSRQVEHHDPDHPKLREVYKLLSEILPQIQRTEEAAAFKRWSQGSK